MKHRLLFFRHAWWVAFTVITVASITILLTPIEGKAAILASVVTLGLGFCYFAQRQNLDELRLFKELFVDFNKRYNDLNDHLLDIRDGRIEDATMIRKILVDYFNLCAEEFFFFRHGHIHEDVWRSWCQGMLFFIEHGKIRPIWDDEVKQDSYYGLTIEKIRKGAG
jgi:hypothetical protein